MQVILEAESLFGGQGLLLKTPAPHHPKFAVCRMRWHQNRQRTVLSIGFHGQGFLDGAFA